jgi:hypothetical protein
MANSSDFTNLAGMTKEMRDRVLAAFDALSNWRDEIETAERCLGKVLDQTSAVARSMGWPDEAIKTMREYLQHTGKVQTKLIDQLIEGWKQQLKSPIAPMAIPRGLTGQTSGPSASTMVGGHVPNVFDDQHCNPFKMPTLGPSRPATMQVAPTHRITGAVIGRGGGTLRMVRYGGQRPLRHRCP